MRSKCEKPSLQQFTKHAVRSYFQLAICRVEKHLSQCGKGSIGQLLGIQKSQNYSIVSDAEISERSSFLEIVWESFEIIIEAQKKWEGGMGCEEVLSEIMMSCQHLAKLNSIKQERLYGQYSISSDLQRLIPILYQTQVYAFQMLIRILLLHILYSDQLDKQKQIQRYGDRYISDRYRWSVQQPLPKVKKTRLKSMLQEIEQIFTFYKLQIMVQRVDCRNKPELTCLLEIVQQKVADQLFKLLLDKTALGDVKFQRKNQKATHVEPARKILTVCRLDSLAIAPTLPAKDAKEIKYQQVSFDRIEAVNDLKQAIVQVANRETKEARKQRRMQQKKKSIDHSTAKYNSILAKANLARLVNSSTTLPAFSEGLSLNQKFKRAGNSAISQRFSNRSVIMKRRVRKQKREKKEETPIIRQQRAREVVRSAQFYLRQEDSQDSCLAEETPVQIKRTYLEYYQYQQ